MRGDAPSEAELLAAAVAGYRVRVRDLEPLLSWWTA